MNYQIFILHSDSNQNRQFLWFYKKFHWCNIEFNIGVSSLICIVTNLEICKQLQKYLFEKRSNAKWLGKKLVTVNYKGVYLLYSK